MFQDGRVEPYDGFASDWALHQLKGLDADGEEEGGVHLRRGWCTRKCVSLVGR